MKWNHRLVQISADHDTGPWVEIKECYYNEDGTIAGFADACFGTEYPAQMPELLQRMLTDITKNPDVVKLSDAVGFTPEHSEHF